MKSLTDYELIEESIKGNHDCFSELISRYKNLVYSIVLRMVKDNEEANDLAQEVFIRIYQNLDKYRPEFKFSTWIMRITTNICIDNRRKKRAEFVQIDENLELQCDYKDSPEETLLRKERRKKISEALEALPDMYKIPIILYHKNGLSYAEISKQINEPLTKIKNRIFRGRKMLKELLNY